MDFEFLSPVWNYLTENMSSVTAVITVFAIVALRWTSKQALNGSKLMYMWVSGRNAQVGQLATQIIELLSGDSAENKFRLYNSDKDIIIGSKMTIDTTKGARKLSVMVESEEFANRLTRAEKRKIYTAARSLGGKIHATVVQQRTLAAITKLSEVKSA